MRQDAATQGETSLIHALLWANPSMKFSGLLGCLWKHTSSGTFRKGAQMVGRPSAAEKAGLDADLSQDPDGRWRIRLIDDSGTEVFNRTYTTSQNAKANARYWVEKNYQVSTEEAPRTRRAPYRPRSLGPGTSQLGEMMRARADDNEERAVALRAEADQLETEAKRLRAAADTLEGPDGGN